MNSDWGREIRAILRKEWRSEMRGPSAFFTSLLLSLVTVFVLAFAFFGRTMTPEGGAGMLWAALLFASVSTVARSFVQEEEIGAGDLLRLWARPHAVYWGKTLFAFGQMAFTALLCAGMFIILSGLAVERPFLLAVSLVGGAAALAATVTFCSALIARGANRGSAIGAASLPLLLPIVALGTAAGRGAFGVGSEASAWQSCAGIWCYGALTLAVGPYLFAAIWKER